MDFWKYKGISHNVMTNFGITEAYIERGRQCMGKEVRLRLLNQLDIDSLEERGSIMGIGERASDSHSFSQRTLQEHIGKM